MSQSHTHRKSLKAAITIIVAAMAVYLGGQFIGSLLALLLPLLAGWSETDINRWLESVNGQFIIYGLVQVATLALLGWLLRLKPAYQRHIRLGRPRPKDAVYAAAGYIIYLGFYFIVVIIAQLLLPGLNTEQEQIIGFDGAAGLAQLSLVFIALAVLPPIVEELLVRGFLYGGLRSNLPRVKAIIITSVLFAAPHLQFGSGQPLLWIAAIDTFILSVILINLRERSGDRLWAPIGLHMIKNTVAFFVLFVFVSH